MIVKRAIHNWLRAMVVVLAGIMAGEANAESLANFLPDLSPADLAEGADAFGPIREDVPVAPVLKGGETVAYAFLDLGFRGHDGLFGQTHPCGRRD